LKEASPSSKAGIVIQLLETFSKNGQQITQKPSAAVSPVILEREIVCAFMFNHSRKSWN